MNNLLSHILITEFRLFLRGRGRDVPHLSEIHFECANDPRRTRLRLRFHELPEPVFIQLNRVDVEPSRWPRHPPTDAVYRAYSTALEDHLLEEQLAELNRHVRAIVGQADADDSNLICRIHAWAEHQAERIRQGHYRGRPFTVEGDPVYDREVARREWALRQAQAEINQHRSRALNRVASNPPRRIVARDAVDDVEALRREWARPDGIVQIRPPPEAPDNWGARIWMDWARNAIMTSYVYDGLPVPQFLDGDFDFGGPEAKSRGLALLKSFLTEAQRADYEKHKHFIVVGSDTGRHYRIRHGRQMNIDELLPGEKRDSARVACRWCFLPEGGLVAGDVMLAQKIALENFEKKALKIANRFA